ncbi:hypothetical protein ACC677_38575, partial [Rhizobium ruizarguesonis]
VFFSIDVIPTLYPDLVDALELVKTHWAQIGIDMKFNTIERALYYTSHDTKHGAAGDATRQYFFGHRITPFCAGAAFAP